MSFLRSSPAIIASAIAPQPMNASRQFSSALAGSRMSSVGDSVAIFLRIAHRRTDQLLYRATMSTMTIDEQISYLGKGTVDLIREAELRAKLEKSAKTGKPLRVKLGADPTAPDIHLGHTVVIRKLRAFQELGHVAIFLIGDFTGLIGDHHGE